MERISKRTGKPIAICDGCGYAKDQCQCLELALLQQIKAYQLPVPEREFRFLDDRKFRADFAYPDLGLLIEVEGGTRGVSRHSTHSGYSKDVEKYNLAMLNGWRVLRCTGDQVTNGMCILWIEQAVSESEAA